MAIRLFLLTLLVLSPILSVHAADEDGPEISDVSPLSATYYEAETFYVTASDASGVESCTLLVSSTYETPMEYDAESDQWFTEYTFETERSANSIRAVCIDGLGNETKGPSNIIEVADAPIDTTDGESDTEIPMSEVDATEWESSEIIAASPVLIKTVCPGDEDFTHTCRTVYFLDDEGYRHAFPNERVFFTWYDDYTDLHLVTDDMMASFSLGANVTYHPGSRMVKYQTVNTVYVVERYSVLRPVASEEIAIDLYGSDWNTQIDDISEAFYGNYSYGDPIESTDDFDVDVQEASVDSINDNL